MKNSTCCDGTLKKAMVVGFRFYLAMLMLLSFYQVAAADPTTQEQAAQAALGWLENTDTTVFKISRGNQVKEVKSYTDESGNVIYFIVLLSPKGMVILPADDMVEPIIGFAPDAVEYNHSQNNPLTVLIENDIPYRINVARESQSNLKTMSKSAVIAKGKWDKYRTAFNKTSRKLNSNDQTFIDNYVSPLITTRWNQGYINGVACYNYYTPKPINDNSKNCVCGCVATAMAQLMKQRNFPNTGIGNIKTTIYINDVEQDNWPLLGGDNHGGAYLWDKMVDSPTESSTEACKAIGALTADSGFAAHTNYSSGNSTSSFGKAKDALLDVFKYTNVIHYNASTSIDKTCLNRMINSNLDARIPVMLGIGPDSPHAVLCDGYYYQDSTPHQRSDDSVLYHHLNVGWGDSDQNAYYNLPDGPVNGTTKYRTVTDILYNIYTSGTGEIVSGRVLDKNNNPLYNVEVNITSDDNDIPPLKSVRTDSNGIYAFTNVPAIHNYTLKATLDEYNFPDQHITVFFSEDPTEQDNFETKQQKNNNYTDDTLCQDNATSKTSDVWAVNFRDITP